MKFRSPLSALKRAEGFTLVELLTVIAIIAILMGLLFPAATAVRNSAKQAQAKNDITNIVTAVKAYYTDYGRYPTINTNGGDAIYTTEADMGKLMDILRGIDTTNNPRRTVFLEVANAKNANQPVGGINTNNGAWMDPWGKAYSVQIDSDYNNILTNAKITQNNGELRLGVVSWSLGKDGVDTATNTWVLSWQ